MSQSQQYEVLLSQFSHFFEYNLIVAFSVHDCDFHAHLSVICSSCYQFSKLFILEPFMKRFSLFLSSDNICLPKKLLSNDGYFEFHNIHSEGPCFISENILNLSKLLIERGALDRNILISEGTVHKLIFLDEIFLEQFHHLHRHN